MSALQVASSSGRRAWMATIEAPAFQQAVTTSAISSGWVGSAGLAVFIDMPPVGAMVTMIFAMWRLSLVDLDLASLKAGALRPGKLSSRLAARERRPCDCD